MIGKKFLMMAGIARRVVTGQIVVSVLLVAGMVLANIYFSREAIALRTLETLAKDYYENYFYDKFLGGREDRTALFGGYAENGFGEVSLRQLLSFDGARLAEAEVDFYDCNKKTTTVKITPVEPFGRKDYVLETKLDCE